MFLVNYNSSIIFLKILIFPMYHTVKCISLRTLRQPTVLFKISFMCTSQLLREGGHNFHQGIKEVLDSKTVNNCDIKECLLNFQLIKFSFYM